MAIHHRLRAHPLVGPGVDEAAEVGQRPGARLAPVRVRPAQNVVDQRRLLRLAQPLGPTSVKTVDQPRQALGVEAYHKASRPAWRIWPAMSLVRASAREAIEDPLPLRL